MCKKAMDEQVGWMDGFFSTGNDFLSLAGAMVETTLL